MPAPVLVTNQTLVPVVQFSTVHNRRYRMAPGGRTGGRVHGRPVRFSLRQNVTGATIGFRAMMVFVTGATRSSHRNTATGTMAFGAAQRKMRPVIESQVGRLVIGHRQLESLLDHHRTRLELAGIVASGALAERNLFVVTAGTGHVAARRRAARSMARFALQLSVTVVPERQWQRVRPGRDSVSHTRLGRRLYGQRLRESGCTLETTGK